MNEVNLMKEGMTVIAFNSTEWQKTGDVGDNSQFYQQATVLEVRMSGEYKVADLKFESGLISNGHFLNRLRIVK